MTQSRVKIMQYKKQLQSTKKDSMKMTKYLLKIKNIVDSLGHAGYIVSPEDHVTCILFGPRVEYIVMILLQNEKMIEDQLLLA